MGIFDSKKKRIVGTSIQRVIEDDALPQTMLEALIGAVMDEDPEARISKHVIEAFSKSLALKIDRIYKFAETDYTYGRVQSDLTSSLDGEDVIKAVIEDEINETITIDYFYLAPINWLHVGWMKLVEDYGYNPVTNELTELTTTVGFPVYLQDLVQVFTEESYAQQSDRSLEQWGVPQKSGEAPDRPQWQTLGEYLKHTPVMTSDVATEDHLLVTYGWVDADGERQTDTLEIGLTGYGEDAEYYQLRYRYNDGTDHIVYWLYENGSDLNSSIEAIHDFPFEEIGSYLPWLHFVQGGASLGTEDLVDHPDYKSSVEMCRLFGMDYQSLVDIFMDNPDIGDIEQIMMMVAVDIDDTSELGMRYLFDHFNLLWASGNGAIDGLTQIDLSVGFAQILQDRDFKMTFAYSGITKQHKAGVIAPVGKHARETVSVLIKDRERTGLFGGLLNIIAEEVAGNKHIFRRQVSPQVYEEISVLRPEVTFNNIFGDKSFRASFGSDALIVPVDYSILSTYSLQDREQLIARAMHFVFNTMVVEKTEWYQTGAFKAIMFVAAVALTIYSAGTFSSAIGAAYAAGGAAAVAKLVVTSIIIGFAIGQGAKLLIDAVGGELALLIAAVATVVALAYGPQGFMGGVEGLPWAQDLLMVSNGLMEAIKTEYADLMEEVQQDYAAFLSYAETKNKELDAARDLLKTSTLIDPFAFVGKTPLWIPDETPQSYFNRTIHAGNVGAKSLNAISVYVENTLTLPRLHATIGGSLE